MCEQLHIAYLDRRHALQTGAHDTKCIMLYCHALLAMLHKPNWNMVHKYHTEVTAGYDTGVPALQLYVERLAKAVRKRRADAEKNAAEAQHAAGDGHLPTTGLHAHS